MNTLRNRERLREWHLRYVKEVGIPDVPRHDKQLREKMVFPIEVGDHGYPKTYMEIDHGEKSTG